MERKSTHRTVAVQHTPLWMLQEVDLIKLWKAQRSDRSKHHETSQPSISTESVTGTHPGVSLLATCLSPGARRAEPGRARRNIQGNDGAQKQNGNTSTPSQPVHPQEGEKAAITQPPFTACPKALLELIKTLGVTENERTMLLGYLALYQIQTGKNVVDSSGGLRDYVDCYHERIEDSLKVLDNDVVAAKYNEFGSWVWGLFDDYLACNQNLSRALESRP
jgi:hypothetical protein